MGGRPRKQGAAALQVLHPGPAAAAEGGRAQSQQGLSIEREGEHPLFPREMPVGHGEPGEDAGEEGEQGAEEEADQHYRYGHKRSNTCTFLPARTS